MGETLKFVDARLTPQKRIERLVSGVCNNEMKMLTLYSMKPKQFYSQTELFLNATDYLGEDLDISMGQPLRYCECSLQPISIAAVDSRREEGKNRMVTIYGKTMDGQKYADPSIINFLYAADKFDVPLSPLNGNTNNRGEVRNGYVVANILDLLREGGVRTEANISKYIGVNPGTVSASLQKLGRLDFIEYDSVRTNSYRKPDSGWSRFSLKDRDLAEEFMADDGKIDSIRVDYSRESARKMIKYIMTKEGSILTKKDLDGLSIGSNSMLSVLNRSGIIEYEKFRGNNVMSSAKITDKGREFYDIAFKPVKDISENPNSKNALSSLGELESKLDNSEISALFRSGITRYYPFKHGTFVLARNMDETMNVIRNHIGKGTTFTLIDVREGLKNKGIEMNRSTLSSYLKRLTKSNDLVKVNEVRKNRRTGKKYMITGLYKLID